MPLPQHGRRGSPRSLHLLVTGDDDRDAQVTVRYRPAGDLTWQDAMPLFRVRPETVVGRTVPEQFAGSLFDLAPDTTYDISSSAARFRSPTAFDAIRKVLFKHDRLVVKGGGAAWGYTLDEPTQQRIAVRVTLGTDRPWCAEAPAKLAGTPPSTLGSDRIDRFQGQPRTPPLP